MINEDPVAREAADLVAEDLISPGEVEKPDPSLSGAVDGIATDEVVVVAHADAVAVAARDGVVVDAGYHPGNVGDVELSVAIEKSSAYTPVPGGVGPMTIVSLIAQTVEAAEKGA